MKVKVRFAVLLFALFSAMTVMATQSVTNSYGGVAPVLGSPAAGIIFDDGPINGQYNAFFIDGPNSGPFSQSISDGFVATGSGTATALDFGIWVISGTLPTTVTWWLGTSSFGGDLGSGTVAISSYDYVASNGYGYDVYNVHITGMTSGAMSAGNMYWLTLGNANDNYGFQYEGWDVNEGPAICHFAQSGIEYGDCGDGGEAFTLYSNPVPEPGIIFMLGSGALGVAATLRRKLF